MSLTLDNLLSQTFNKENDTKYLNERYHKLEREHKDLEEKFKELLVKYQIEVEKNEKLEQKYKIVENLYSKNVNCLKQLFDTASIPQKSVKEEIEEEYQKKKQLELMSYELEVKDKTFEMEKRTSFISNENGQQLEAPHPKDEFYTPRKSNGFWTNVEVETPIRDFSDFEVDPNMKKKSVLVLKSAKGNYSASQEEIEKEEEEDDEEAIKFDEDSKNAKKSWTDLIQEEIENNKDLKIQEIDSKKLENEILAKKLGSQVFQQSLNISADIVNKIRMGIELVLKSSINVKDKQRKFKIFDNIVKKDFEFRDHSPEIFTKLRILANVPDQEFRKSICEGNMKVIVTPGKSGAILFFTGDKKYLLKSVSETELKFLQSILPKYYQHTLCHPYTLICRLLGLYTLKNQSYQLNFIAMENVFPTPPQETYDLKGSSIGRDATDEEKKKNFFKDNDFLLKKTKISIIKDYRGEFMHTLMEDCNFLSSLEIMDYSLLLGISQVTDQDKFNENSKTRFTNFKSADGKLKYNLGVIDILQKWNLKKIAEMGLKSVVQEKKGLSSVPPKEYSQRFVDFINSNTISPQNYVLI